ncbi:MAG: hypothetical protein AABY15_00390 [Nanoarchaeota archaeon]
MKGRITLQPLREEKFKTKEWPVFGKEEAIFGFLKSANNVEVTLTDGDKILRDDVHEFMVRLEDDSLVELNHDNIDEAMGNDWWDYYGDMGRGKELDFEVKDGIATVVIHPVEIGKTGRGFSLGEFEDQYGKKCSIQKSSIATRDCIWLGVDDPEPQIMVSDARRLGITSSMANGWMPYNIPTEVNISTRMHLSREDVKKLLPLLQKFAETGSLTE